MAVVNKTLVLTTRVIRALVSTTRVNYNKKCTVFIKKRQRDSVHNIPDIHKKHTGIHGFNEKHPLFTKK